MLSKRNKTCAKSKTVPKPETKKDGSQNVTRNHARMLVIAKKLFLLNIVKKMYFKCISFKKIHTLT